jgi:hypothetical protein
VIFGRDFGDIWMLILFNAPIYNKVEKENFKKNPQMGNVGGADSYLHQQARMKNKDYMKVITIMMNGAELSAPPTESIYEIKRRLL